MTPNVCCPECGFEITKALAQARAEALEEAARVADKRTEFWKLTGEGVCSMSLEEEAEDIAAAIRALKDGEPKP